MELNDAVRRMVRNYPGGIKAVAVRLGKSDSTLEKEIRAAHGFKLGLQDASDVLTFCHDVGSPAALDLLHLLAHSVNHAVLPLPTVPMGNLTLERLGNLMRECGDLVSTVTTAQADGSVCDNELKECFAAWAEMVAAGTALMQSLQESNAQTMARWEGR